MIANVFSVATEFNWEIGNALLASRQMTDGINQISQAADKTLSTVKNLGYGLAANLGLGQLGAIGIFKSAVESNNDFRKLQLSLANLISANKDNLIGPIDTFNDRLNVSAMVLGRIGKMAREFSLDEKAFVKFTETTLGMLLPKKLAGQNFDTAINLSRQVLKAAPIVYPGMNPMMLQNDIQEIIEGRAGSHNVLFRRLGADTNVFQEAFKGKGGKGGVASLFNATDVSKRVELLSKALNTFAKDTDVVAGNVNTLTGQMTRLNTLITGPVSSILRPLGEVLTQPLLEVMKGFGDVLDNQGRTLVASFARILKPIIGNPERLLVDVLQVRRLSADSQRTMKFGKVIAEVVGAMSLLHFATKIPVVGPFFASLREVIFSARALAFSAVGTGISKSLGFIFSGRGLLRIYIGFFEGIAGIASVAGKVLPVLARVLGPTALLFALFQTISRAIAIAHISDAKEALKIAPQLSQSLEMLGRNFAYVLSPVTELLDAVAHLLSPLFKASLWMKILMFNINGLNAVLQLLGTVVSWIKGLVLGLGQVVQYLLTGGWQGATPFQMWDDMKAQFMDGWTRMMRQNVDALKGPDGAVVSQTTNIGKVEITNQFKEQMEPDRIAFALVHQLKKTAQNPTQARAGALGNIDNFNARGGR